MKLLMHICCAPCANLPIDVLRADAVGAGNVAGRQLVGKDVDKRRVLEHQISLLAAGGGLDDLLLFQKLSLNFTRVAFGCDCHENHPFFVIIWR